MKPSDGFLLPQYSQYYCEMKKCKYMIAATFLAALFWFFDAVVHYFIYGEPEFEFFPTDFNELWMRTTIITLLILFGMYADYSARKLLMKEKELEAARIYKSMIYASHHILNNLLNQMQIVKMEALNSKDFDKKFIGYYDAAFDEATDLIKKLSEVDNITEEDIWASIDPDKLSKSDRKSRKTRSSNNSVEA